MRYAYNDMTMRFDNFFNRLGRRLGRYRYEGIVFICSAVLMMLEMVGSRILAPYVGMSTYVWSLLIGVIMGALSVGYYFGGKLSDKTASPKMLSTIVIWAALSVLVVALMSNHVLETILVTIQDIYLRAFIATLSLFVLPSLCLGMVSPSAVKSKLVGGSLTTSGQTVGNLYAVSAVGSILGTFSASMLFIPRIGSSHLLLMCVLLLSWAAFIAYPGKYVRLKFLLMLVLTIGAVVFLRQKLPDQIRDVNYFDSMYSRLKLFKTTSYNKKDEFLWLTSSPLGAFSGIQVNNPNYLVVDYLRFFRIVDAFHDNLRNVLVIGGAGFSHPRDFLASHDQAIVDVVEIDPVMVDIAKKYFYLQNDPRMKIYIEDGRAYLNSNSKKYDAVFIDAYNSSDAVPFQLTTIEAVSRIYTSLTNDGIALFNIVSSIEGERSQFLRAEYSTIKHIFPEVKVYRIIDKPPELVQNIVLVAMKSKKPSTTLCYASACAEWESYFNKEWKKPIVTDLPIITDDIK